MTHDFHHRLNNDGDQHRRYLRLLNDTEGSLLIKVQKPRGHLDCGRGPDPGPSDLHRLGFTGLASCFPRETQQLWGRVVKQ